MATQGEECCENSTCTENTTMGTPKSNAPPQNEGGSEDATKSSSSSPEVSQDKILVCIRMRPLNEKELRKEKKSRHHSSLWKIQNNNISLCSDRLDQSPLHTFTFDHIFNGDKDMTSEIYSKVARPIVHSSLLGYNGTIFAYGQTSTGKTFTMKGDKSCPGVIPNAVHEIFDYIAKDDEYRYDLRVSYLEIYNEVIMDLLEPSKSGLRIHEDIQRGVFVGKLKEEYVNSVDQVMKLMNVGESNIHYGSTGMNDRSSRSHTIFRIAIECKNTESDSFSISRVSTLNFVDLAGSERVAHTNAEGGRLIEGGYINKSLLTLGHVISKLSEGCTKHIPYRDSKLTRILQPSLGGNAKTAVICTITPAIIHAEETLSTLKFASRAKCISNKPRVNEHVSEKDLVNKLKQERDTWKLKYKRLEKENHDLREEVKRLSPSDQETQQIGSSSPCYDSEYFQQLEEEKEEIERMMEERIEMMKKMHEEEVQELKSRISELEDEISEKLIADEGSYSLISTLKNQVKKLLRETHRLRKLRKHSKDSLCRKADDSLILQQDSIHDENEHVDLNLPENHKRRKTDHEEEFKV